jgi:DNA-binding XRE family transcriptional regulator
MKTGPLTKIRRELGLSTGEFAKLLNLAPITVVRIEQGRSRIPLKARLPIANLGIDFFQVMIEQEHHIGMRRYRVL